MSTHQLFSVLECFTSDHLVLYLNCGLFSSVVEKRNPFIFITSFIYRVLSQHTIRLEFGDHQKNLYVPDNHFYICSTICIMITKGFACCESLKSLHWAEQAPHIQMLQSMLQPAPVGIPWWLIAVWHPPTLSPHFLSDSPTILSIKKKKSSSSMILSKPAVSLKVTHPNQPHCIIWARTKWMRMPWLWKL